VQPNFSNGNRNETGVASTSSGDLADKDLFLPIKGMFLQSFLNKIYTSVCFQYKGAIRFRRNLELPESGNFLTIF
jgi:hypothetical protein